MGLYAVIRSIDGLGQYLSRGLDLVTGEIIPLIRDSHKSSDFIDFLKMLDNKYSDASVIKIVMDNHSVHTSKKTRMYLESCLRRFKFIFTLKHGSWLNLIESFFGKLSRVCLKGMRVKSKQELTDRIYRYIDKENEDPVIYRWTYEM
jgi:transposase